MKPIVRCCKILSGAAAGFLLLFAGCTSEPEAPLRIGINAWPGYEFLFLAQEKGFYRDEGLNVRILEFNSLSDARRAYERGQIDGFGTTVIEVLQAREFSNRSPQIIQVIDSSDGADIVITQTAIKNAASLRGKKVGVELGSLGVYILARCLDKHGLKLGDVTTISSDQMSMEREFLEGKIDAIVTYPPTSIKLLNTKKAHPFFTTAEIPGEVVDVIAVEEEVNRQRSGDVAKLIRAYHRAVDYSKQNPADAYKIMAEREGLTPGEFASALEDGINLIPAADQSTYLKAGGKLSRIIDTSDRVLRLSSQIKGPDRRATIVNADFAESDNASQ
jgi:NitT/TauT family transport system substrate-binding protein